MADSAREAERAMGLHERVAAAFHREYEERAPGYGYETRRESAVPWERVPQRNRQLMEAVVAALMRQGIIAPGDRSLPPVDADPEPCETCGGTGFRRVEPDAIAYTGLDGRPLPTRCPDCSVGSGDREEAG